MTGARGILAFVAVLVLCPSAMPAPEDEADEPLRVSGGYTVAAQASGESGVQPGVTASADVFLVRALRRGAFRVWIEASTTPRSDGVGSLLPEANADAATAVDGDGTGRIQVSELVWVRELGGDRTLTAGLVDVTVWLDTTRVANDENMQFLGAPFVNNPSVEFPDYAPGVAYEQPSRGRWPGITLVAASSDGLADTPGRSYDELWDLADSGRGVFVGIETGWSGVRHHHRVGSWANTRSRERLDGPGDAPAYGVYLTTGLSFGRRVFNLRIGLADPDASASAAFASATFQRHWPRRVLGVGASRTWRSDDVDDPDTGDAVQLEGYLRFEIAPDLFLTPSLQYRIEGGFPGPRAVRDERAVVAGVRLHHKF